MKLLHMKIFDLLLEPDLDFLRFPKHKTGWGVRYPGQGIFTPTIYHRSSDTYIAQKESRIPKGRVSSHRNDVDNCRQIVFNFAIFNAINYIWPTL